MVHGMAIGVILLFWKDFDLEELNFLFKIFLIKVKLFRDGHKMWVSEFVSTLVYIKTTLKKKVMFKKKKTV